MQNPLRPILRLSLPAAALLVALSLGPAAPAAAQTDTSVLNDSTLFLIDPRPEDDIKRDQDAAAAAGQRAQAVMQRASLQVARAEADIKLKEAEIKSIKTDMDAANDAKDDARKKDLDQKKKMAELEKDFLDAKKDMRDDEVKAARAQAEAADADGRFFELERDLLHKRGERNGYSGQALTASVQSSVIRLDGELRDLERKALEARLQSADKDRSAAEALLELYKSRKSVSDETAKVMKGVS